MELEKNEIELINFLFNYRLNNEIESITFDVEDIDYIKSLNGNYKEMFDFSNCHHNDERLTNREKEIIEGIYQKFMN